MSDRLPRYRVLTGPDDAAFRGRVSEALDLGYTAQAAVWPGRQEPPAAPVA